MKQFIVPIFQYLNVLLLKNRYKNYSNFLEELGITRFSYFQQGKKNLNRKSDSRVITEAEKKMKSFQQVAQG